MRYGFFRSFSAIFNRLLGPAVKATVTTLVCGACVVGILHYMGIPIPSAHELIHGFMQVFRN